MATTSNFGWTTPDDTDLVKDGAAAIRTLGSAIDTSLVDLKGGTTGQVLSKTSDTDMDFTWVAQDDTDAIQSSIIAAKGDLIVGTANDTAGILSVGTDGYTLVADSVETTGLKWVAPASPTPSSDWTLISSGALSGTTISIAASGYDRYILQFNIYSSTTGVTMKYRFNNLSTSNYRYLASMSGAATTQTDVDGINLDNFSTFNDQPNGFLEINNANNGAKPQFFGSWKRANNPADNTRAYVINYSGLFNSNITLSSIDLVSTANIDDLTYRLWGL